ncbi:MAG TPA: trypsin-like peptidase domain-containing protein [Steroidobacter sp.]|jgi:S1-C subfamily serine protease|nr:trypsin-like peptidase domain-containing protein [Steroidobacteraceae bacterium]HLS81739.1 trypsin-like peptidase domain-containing protein [Steroidobacter sp.]
MHQQLSRADRTGDSNLPSSPFRSYGRATHWLLFILLAATFAWYAVPEMRWRATRADAQPRPVVARGELSQDELTTIEIFERSKGSVVYISTRSRVVDLWTRNVLSVPRGTGSGFIWDGRGHVVTNLHVIAGAAEASVQLSDGRSYAASLVGASAAHDLAVLRVRVPMNAPPALPIGSSGDLRVGQKVFAIGNPFGLDWTLTTGIVSALDRSLPGENGRLITHLIQTDAAINPGNSGGPLLDSAGRLIGVNTAIYSPSGASAGVGFAVPVDMVNRVVPQLIAQGRYAPPSLGVEVDESLNRALMRELGIEGVAVLRVLPGSGAEQAGLRGVTLGRGDRIIPGDVILEIDQTPVTSVGELLAQIDDRDVGDTVNLTIWRETRQFNVEVRLGASSEGAVR